MYRKHFALTDFPFDLKLEPEDLFASATQGMPRKVNRLAHYALTSAALDKAMSVTIEHVQAALEEIVP